MVALPGVLTFIVLATTSILLVRTTLNYLEIMNLSFQKPSPTWVTPALWIGYATFVAIILVLVFLRTVGIGRQSNPRLRPRSSR
jgi:hypothetical protein